MPIKTFFSEMAGVPQEKNLPEKIIKKDVITHADVKEYAQYILQRLQELKKHSEDEKELFVVDVFSDSSILAKVKDQPGLNNLDENEAISVIDRIRRALIEELKGRVDDKIYFIIKNIQNTPENKFRKKSIISIAENVDSGPKEGVMYKDQKIIGKEHVDVEKSREEAFGLLKNLPQHPNIVGVREYDGKNQRGIFEKLNLQNLDEYLGEKTEVDKEKLINSLNILRDSMDGALYLEKNGLTLQDISLKNIGIAETEQGKVKGMLFDLEGIMKTGTKINYRLAMSNDYAPPEFLSHSTKYNSLNPKEMVYQFGVCLQKITDKYVDFAKKSDKHFKKSVINQQLQILTEKMTEERLFFRIKLADAISELDRVINVIK